LPSKPDGVPETAWKAIDVAMKFEPTQRFADVEKFWQAVFISRTLEGHTSGAISVSFSPDGSLIASGSLDKTIKIWRVSDGSLVRTLTGHTNRVESVTFSPDGSLIASGSDDNTIKIWRVSDGSLVRTLKGHTSYVISVTFSPDGSLIASGSLDETIKIWSHIF
jgi:WD40 repeat protein